MSLINDMLKNLEQRQLHNAVAQNSVLAGLTTNTPSSFSRLFSYSAWFIYGTVILLLLIYLLWPTPKNVLHNLHKTLQASAPVSVKTQPIISTIPASNPAHSLTLPTRIVQIDAFGISGDLNNTKLNIYLNQNTPYTVTTDQTHNLLFLTLANTQLAEPLLPLNTRNTVIQNMQVNQKEHQLQIVLSLLNGTQVIRMAQINAPSPQLILELTNPAQALVTAMNHFPDNTALTTPGLNGVALNNNDDYVQAINPVEKVPKPLTAEQMADLTYQKALDLVQKNQITSALNLLKQLLTQMPSYFTAREALVTLLIQQNQLQDATTVINEGLKLQPHYPPFTKLAAQIFMAKNQPANALAILQTAAPSLTEDPDYYAFIAAIYQRLDQPLEAAKLYNELVEQFPTYSLWWLGLATSLETLGKNRAALEAYHNASASGNLTPQLETFVERKIDLLGN